MSDDEAFYAAIEAEEAAHVWTITIAGVNDALQKQHTKVEFSEPVFGLYRATGVKADLLAMLTTYLTSENEALAHFKHYKVK